MYCFTVILFLKYGKWDSFHLKFKLHFKNVKWSTDRQLTNFTGFKMRKTKAVAWDK